jgi:hypothetical protein
MEEADASRRTYCSSAFKPFRLVVSDGAAFDIRHPEMLMVTRRTAIVGIVTNGGLGETGNGSDFPDIECSATVDLLHITRIENIT